MRQLRVIMVAALALLAGIEIAVAQSATRRVLLVQSFSRNYTAWNSIALRLEEGLIKHSPYRINLYKTPLETERLGPSYNARPFLEYLRTLFSEQEPDVAIAVGAPAARFMLAYRAELFPNTPLLLTGADPRTFAAATRSSNDVVIPVVLDHARQVDNILQVLPGTRHIAVVIGASDVERFWLEELKRTFAPYEGKVTFEYFNDLTLDGIVSRAANLPQHSAIYYGSLRVDAQGVSYAEENVLAHLKAATNAPIFTFVDSNFGAGIVGGPMIAVDDVARQSAEVTERLLRGEAPASIVTTTVRDGAPRYDGRELTRWNIDEQRLPPNSQVLFREPGAWDHYRVQIMAVCAALLLQAGLISWLIYEHRRRHLAEVQSRGLIIELTHVNRLATAGELSASIAHEISQPLTRVMASASAADRWLAAQPPDLARARELLHQVRNATERTADIIASTRAMFAKDAGVALPIDLNQLLQSIVALVRHDLQQNGIELERSLAEEPVVVLGDKVQLQQVVLNLVMNAIEAMHGRERRVLRMRCARTTADSIRVAVEDTGGGIADDHLERIFDPLFTTKQHGMGMGLAICRSIIEKQNGRIWAARSPEGGSIFCFELPVAARDEKAQRAPREPPPRPVEIEVEKIAARKSA